MPPLAERLAPSPLPEGVTEAVREVEGLLLPLRLPVPVGEVEGERVEVGEREEECVTLEEGLAEGVSVLAAPPPPPPPGLREALAVAAGREALASRAREGEGVR